MRERESGRKKNSEREKGEEKHEQYIKQKR